MDLLRTAQARLAAYGVLRSLRPPRFALLDGTEILSLGNNFYPIALSWWVCGETGSAVAMGNVLIFY